MKKTLQHPRAKPEERIKFKNKIETYEKEGKPLIYIDESGFSQDMPRTHGYALKGQKCFGTFDWGKGKRTNAIGALLKHKLLTVSLFESSINSDIFSCWISQDLLPKLPANSVLIIDNASFHKRKDIQENIERSGHILEFLPTYSPDLNKIEQKWAQAKSKRRKYFCDVEELFEKYVS